MNKEQMISSKVEQVKKQMEEIYTEITPKHSEEQFVYALVKNDEKQIEEMQRIVGEGDYIYLDKGINERKTFKDDSGDEWTHRNIEIKGYETISAYALEMEQ